VSQPNFRETLAQITQQIEQLQAQNEQQQAEIAQLKATQPVTTDPQPLPTSAPQSRRKLLKRMAVVLAVAPALATTANQAKAAATGTVTGASTNNFGLTAAPNNVAPFIPADGLFGLIGITDRNNLPPNARSSGVFGYSSDDFGVSGVSTNSFGVSGSSVNHVGVLGNTTTGIGVVGNTTTGNGIGIQGRSVSGVGVSGVSTHNTAVLGESITSTGVNGSSVNHVGVVGSSDSATGVFGFSNSGYGGNFVGGQAALRLEPPTNTPTRIPTTDIHFRGELVVSNEIGDATNLYFCTQGDGTGVGTWVRLNQPYTAGSNIAISPRNSDGTFTISTTGSASAVTSVNGQTGAVNLALSNIVFLTSAERIAASLNSGGTFPLLTSDGTGNPNATFQAFQISGTSIPITAKGIIGSLTSVGATRAGNLRLWAFGSPSPPVNTLNIPAKPDGTGFNLTTAFTVGLSTGGKVSIGYSNGNNGATCGFTLDVVAYII
jgi:hypothetical protein